MKKYYQYTGVVRGDATRTCEKACKTKKPVTITETNVTAKKVDYLTSSQTYNSITKPARQIYARCPR